MTSRAPLILAFVVALAALPVALSTRGLRDANAEFARTQALLDTAHEMIREIDALRAAKVTASLRPRPERDLINRIGGVLESSGASSRQLSGITPLSDQAIGGDAPYREQVVQVTLKRMTVADLGRFLSGWTNDQPLWIPRSISLTHSRDGDRYDVTIDLSNTYLDLPPRT